MIQSCGRARPSNKPLYYELATCCKISSDNEIVDIFLPKNFAGFLSCALRIFAVKGILSFLTSALKQFEALGLGQNGGDCARSWGFLWSGKCVCEREYVKRWGLIEGCKNWTVLFEVYLPSDANEDMMTKTTCVQAASKLKPEANGARVVAERENPGGRKSGKVDTRKCKKGKQGKGEKVFPVFYLKGSEKDSWVLWELTNWKGNRRRGVFWVLHKFAFLPRLRPQEFLICRLDLIKCDQL